MEPVIHISVIHTYVYTNDAMGVVDEPLATARLVTLDLEHTSFVQRMAQFTADERRGSQKAHKGGLVKLSTYT